MIAAEQRRDGGGEGMANPEMCRKHTRVKLRFLCLQNSFEPNMYIPGVPVICRYEKYTIYGNATRWISLVTYSYQKDLLLLLLSIRVLNRIFCCRLLIPRLDCTSNHSTFLELSLSSEFDANKNGRRSLAVVSVLFITDCQNRFVEALLQIVELAVLKWLCVCWRMSTNKSNFDVSLLNGIYFLTFIHSLFASHCDRKPNWDRRKQWKIKIWCGQIIPIIIDTSIFQDSLVFSSLSHCQTLCRAHTFFGWCWNNLYFTLKKKNQKRETGGGGR